MLDGPLVFFDTDTQRDFLEPGGALYIAGSEEILPNLARLTAFARRHGIPVLASACAHLLDEAGAEPFPPHCLLGTRGHERMESTAWPGGHVVGLGERGPDAIAPHLTIHKGRYDVFSHPHAERIVALYARGQPTFVVYGVATDYCVRAVVHGLLERGYKVAVVADAVRAVDPGAEADVLTEFALMGALLTLTEVVCATS